MKASDMSKGLTIRLDGRLYTILDFEHVKLGKGGAIYQTKLKSLADGSVQNARIRAEETIEEVELDERDYEYLYSEGEHRHVLMDCKTFDQITVDSDVLGDGVKYLMPNMQIKMELYEDRPVTVTLPNTVDLKVVDTQPEIKWATQSAQAKPATLETGAIVQVPPFVKVGEVIRVDTRTGQYVTRVRE
ncbi:MAG: elongation factor P [Phycisphaerae bacterium]|nr:elongation factor P [Phycisphaerae bacterium]